MLMFSFWKWMRRRRAPENSDHRALGSRERRFLSETIQVEEELLPSFVRPILALVTAMVLIFIAWAALAHITEVTRAPGEIAPSGQIKVVQHLDGGTVAEIAVEEHALVKAGQILARMDGSQANSDLRQMVARQVSLQLRKERLAAFVDNRQPNFEALAADHPELIANQRNIYLTQVDVRNSTLTILDRQIAQRSERVRQLQAALAIAHEHRSLTGELATMREDLAARRLINRTVLLETRRAKVTAEGEVGRIEDEIIIVGQELGEVRNRRIDTLNQLRRDALAEIGTVSAELAEVEENIKRLNAKVDRLVIRAPNHGYVQDLKIQTVGQVVLPGALLMQIVPDDAPLEAVIRIAPKDIGYVKVGQPVNLRVSSFDYSRFGFAHGAVKRITASSVLGEDGKPFYRAWVGLTKPYLGDTPGRYPLQSGMGVEAEILTGQKTLLAYLAKPLIDVGSRSFHER